MDQLINYNLAELENIITKGLETFVEVGQALKVIKDRRLWVNTGYTSFDSYCQGKWGFGQGNAYYLIGTSEVANNVGATTSVAAHIAPFRPLEPENQRRAWAELETVPAAQRTGKHAKVIATKYKIIEKLGHTNPITQAMLAGQVTPNQAAKVALELKNAPDAFVTAVAKWGCPQPGAIQSLLNLRHEFPDEVNAILVSGVLPIDPKPVKFKALAPWHIERYQRALVAEKIAVRQIRVAAGQAKKVRATILDGVDTLNLPPDAGDLLYLFPHDTDLVDLTAALDRQGYDVFMVVAHKNNPKINFNANQQVPIKSVNGVKPEPVLAMMEAL